MKKASIIMAGLACAIIASAYTNSVPISTNTRAATEKWTAIRFEPALPPTPANAASKFLDGNREWQTAPAEVDPVANAKLVIHTNRADNPHGVTAVQIGALTEELDPVANAALVIHTNRIDNPHGVTAVQIGAITAEADPVAGPRLDLIEPEMDKWSAAYGWGNHALAGYLLLADLAPYATTGQVAQAAAAIPRDRITTQDGSQWIDATGGVWKVVDTPATNWFYTDSFSPGVTSLLAGVDYPLPPNWHASTPNGAVDCFSDGEIYIYYGSVTFSEYAATIFATISATSATRFEDWFGWAEIFPLEIWSASTQRVDGVAWQSDLSPYAAHIYRTDNPHGVTAPQIGALTAEQDLAALRAYHYGSPDIVESPAGWFVFDGAGTITWFNWAEGRENVVIPWEIGGVPVTAIGDGAFQFSGLVSVIAPQTVTSMGDYAFANCISLASVSLPQATSIGNAFAYCTSLASVSLPQAQTIGGGAFANCISLASVSLPQAQTIGGGAFVYCTSLAAVHMGRNAPAEATSVFAGITTPPTVYVTDPQATGWGDTWNGAPVVRPPLHGSNVTAQAFTLGGDTITEWPAGGGGGATNITDGVTSGTYSEATRTLDISNLLAGVSMELPDGIVTNGMSGPIKIGSVTLTDNGGIEAPKAWFDMLGINNTINNQSWANTEMQFDYERGWVLSGDPDLPVSNVELFVFDLYGNSTAVGTNTAAVVVSHGPVLFGPVVNDKQARIFTDGTNTYQTDVNAATNLLVKSPPGSNGVSTVWKGSASSFESVADIDSNTVYFVEDDGTAFNTQGIYRDLEIYNAIPSPYTTTVSLVENKTTYHVNVHTNMILAFGTNSLNITGKEVEFKLRLEVTETNIPSMEFVGMAFDVEPEILVTGIWEFAVSTVDGVKYRAKQTWPETDEWATASYAHASAGWVASLQRMDTTYASTNSLMCVCPPAPLLLIRPGMRVNANKPTSFSYGFAADRTPLTSVPTVIYGPFSVTFGYNVDATHAVENPSEYGLVQIWVGNSSPDSIATVLVSPGQTSIRPANANERAAYAAGWRP